MAGETQSDKSSEDTGASVLEKAIEASQTIVGEGEHGDVDAPLFSGHPADTTPGTSGSERQPTDGDNKQPESTKNEPDAAAAGAGSGDGDTPGTGGDTPAGDTAPAETPAPGGDTPGTGGDTPAGQFKTLEEATTAFKNLQSLMNKQGTELGELRARAKADQQNKAAAEAEAELQKEMSVFVKEQNAETLKAINALDQEAEDYDQQVADLWAQKDMAVYQWQREHVSAPQSQNTSSPGPGDTPGDNPPSAGEKHPNIVYAEEQAKAAGLDPEDQVFKWYMNDVKNVDKDGKPRLLKDMVQEIVDNTKAYHDNRRSAWEKEQEKKAANLATEHQRRNQPLDTSAAVPAPSAPAKEQKQSIGIGGALDAVAEERRL